MKFVDAHPWNVTTQEAREIQEKLKKKISLKTSPKAQNPKTIAGVDVSYSKEKKRLYAAVCVFSFPELKLLEEKAAERGSSFPYIPGLLVFREGRVIVDALKKLSIFPDVILFDGQGIAHPQGIGIATHMGILLDNPTIGVAKSPLVGEFKEPENKAGAASPLIYKEKEVGIVLRTKKNVKPVFVSPGHKISFGRAKEIVLKTTCGYRLPEPLRFAHIFSNKLKKKDKIGP